MDQALHHVCQHRYDAFQPISFIISPTLQYPTAVLYQSAVLEWIHFSKSSQHKVLSSNFDTCASLILKGRLRSIHLFAKEPAYIIHAFSESDISALLATSLSWGTALVAFPEQTSTAHPADKILQFLKSQSVVLDKLPSQSPIPGAL